MNIDLSWFQSQRLAHLTVNCWIVLIVLFGHPSAYATEQLGQCGEQATLISAIQGSGETSPLLGKKVIVEGVVTAFIPALSGFFLQEEGEHSDQNLATSEAIFVYQKAQENSAQPGQLLRLQGTISEFHNRTQLDLQQHWLTCNQQATIQPISVILPLEVGKSWEAYEGMLVQFPSPLQITDSYNFAKYGQFSVSNGRRFVATNLYRPGTADARALAAQNRRNEILIDDMNNARYPAKLPYPAPKFSHQNPLRLGDSVTGVQGVIDFSFDNYRLLPTKSMGFESSNARSLTPSLNTKSDLVVASFNVLNLFNGDGKGAGFPTARGANSAAEFERQVAKIVAAITRIDAAVLGLVELENDGYAANSAIADLVNRLNQQVGSQRYSYINPGSPQLGSDVISVGIVYQPSKVLPIGSAVTTATPPFNEANRQPLAQTFQSVENHERFTFVINHFKSKGGCNRATGDNADQNDGQGCWNAMRVAAANTLINWLASYPTGDNDADILIMGDLNAYAQEDPINTFERAGYQNLIAAKQGAMAYSYSYAGELGYLDHALASAALSEQVIDSLIWHINADEATALDYNTENKSAEQLNDYYRPDPFRASDHDPVIVTLSLKP